MYRGWRSEIVFSSTVEFDETVRLCCSRRYQKIEASDRPF